ncbi:hypothetical protein Y032_0200g1682 [Ancylostoma ceylanicum]|uniref:Uncharacterized protein n=1 Tax=Ancylostoma ceylanicum TaxID=53326 RepID=A0A016SMQ4_9BILA|nr:hypothetical protein Y032_0200g1682 [Ancylostoma ceylanicum]
MHCSELQTAVDKWRDRSAAFLDRDARALYAGSGFLLRRGTRVPYCRQKQATRASMQSPCVSVQERRIAVPPLVYGLLESTVRFMEIPILILQSLSVSYYQMREAIL